MTSTSLWARAADSSVRRSARRVLFWACTAVAAGDTLHLVLHRFGTTLPLGHHAFHVLYIGGAAALFFGWVAVDSIRHGPPRFSWRL